MVVITFENVCNVHSITLGFLKVEKNFTDWVFLPLAETFQFFLCGGSLRDGVLLQDWLHSEHHSRD